MTRRLALTALTAGALIASAASAAELHGTLHALRHLSPEQLAQQAARPQAPQSVDPLSIYSDITNMSPLGLFAQGGATPTGSGAFITRTWMDDLVFTTNPGVGLVTTVRFAVYNINGGPVTARVLVRFWQADGALLGSVPGPGTYYAPAVPGGPIGLTFAPFTYAPGVTILSATVPGGGFSVPAGTTTRLWAGIAFDSQDGAGGNTGATQAQMNNITQTNFNPIDRGSSVDLMFQATSIADLFGVANPAGSGFNLGGNPLMNVGWELVVSTLPVELQGFSIE